MAKARNKETKAEMVAKWNAEDKDYEARKKSEKNIDGKRYAEAVGSAFQLNKRQRDQSYANSKLLNDAEAEHEAKWGKLPDTLNNYSLGTPPLTNGEIDRGENMKKGGSVGSASKRADGCAVRGKTRA